ncbi:hypothetical protein JOM56_008076 [Amanita muscaria]
MSISVQDPTFSPEIISEIIGYLHEDKRTLLSLGLVSKQTLYETRHHLFSTVEFSGARVWKDFDKFLRLVDVAWTSFTPAIQCTNFQRGCLPPNDDSAGREMARIRTNLRNVKSLRLVSLIWKTIPSYILDLIFQLHIEHLSLCWLYSWGTTDLFNIFRRFPPSLRTLDFKGMGIVTMPDLSEDPSIFHRSFRFETLDSQSIFLFKSVWDPSICHDLDIKVKSFYLQPLYDLFQLHQREAPFISRFLQRIGPSLEHLTISLTHYSRPYSSYEPGISSLLDPIHVSQCVNLRSLEIGEIRLEDQAPDSAKMIDVVRTFLSALPSPRALQEISITVNPIAPSLEDHLAVLKLFKWSSLVETVQRLFPNLHKLIIHMGTREPLCFNIFLDLLRQVPNLKELEKAGVIELRMFFL